MQAYQRTSAADGTSGWPPAGYEAQAANDLRLQAAHIADGLKSGGIDAPADREIVALIAYLQRLGTDIKVTPKSGGVAVAGAGGQ